MKEVVVIELAVPIEVKVIHHENEVFGRDLSVTVFPFELAKFFRADEA